jgi:hypothetical protein
MKGQARVKIYLNRNIVAGQDDPEQVSAELLAQARKMAEGHEGVTVGTPTYFYDDAFGLLRRMIGCWFAFCTPILVWLVLIHFKIDMRYSRQMVWFSIFWYSAAFIGFCVWVGTGIYSSEREDRRIKEKADALAQ